MALFTVTCTTCTARLSVRDTAVIGQIVECPKCGSMVEIAPPAGWQPPPPVPASEHAPAKPAAPPAKSAAPLPPAPRTAGANSPSSTKLPSTALPAVNAPSAATRQIAGAPQSSPRPTATPAAAVVPPSTSASKPPRHNQPSSPHLAEMAEAGLDLEAVARQYVAAHQRRPSGPGASQDAPAEPSPSSSEGDRPAAAQPTNRHRRIIATSCAALVLMAAAVWGGWPRTEPIETPEPPPIATQADPPPITPVKTPDPAIPGKDKEPPITQPPPAVVDPRWLPPGTQAVVSLRLPEILRQDELGQLLRRADPLWRQGVRPLTRGLGLAVDDIRRVTWATTNAADLPRASVIVVELNQKLTDSDAQRWLSGAVPCDFMLGDAACHRRDESAWPHPFALVDPQTLVTGPIALLRAIAVTTSDAARAAATVSEQLLAMVDADRELVLVADAGSLRGAGVDWPAAWLADRAELRDYWQAIRGVPRGIVLQVSLANGLSIEGQSLCADESAAAGMQAGLEKLLRALASALATEAEPFLKRPEAAELDAAVFTAASLALSRPKAGCRGNVAWVQCSLSTEAAQFAATAWATWRLWDYLRRPAERSEPRVVVDLSGLERKLPAVEYTQAPLAGFVEDMSRVANVPIAIDLDALGEAGLGPESKLSVKRADAAVAAVLRAALDPLRLDYTADPEGLLVTTKARLRDEPRVVEYDVADLAADEPAAARLAELCRQMVEPAAWNASRGQASLKVVGGKLVVRQSGSIHDDFQLFLDKLRVARGRPPQRLTGLKLDTRFARVRERLQKEVTANFSQPTPLARVTDYLTQRSGTTVLVDRVALNKAGVDADNAVITAEKEPLREVLDKLCGSLEIGWRIVDEKTLQITSRGAALRGDVEFYAVADLLGGETGEALAARIQSAKGSDTWSAAGGQGAVHFDAASRHLIVWQSPAVHLQIEDLFALERAKKTGKPAAERASESPQ